jgi:hypothetical protein
MSYYISYYSDVFENSESVAKLLIRLEAAIGIEPMNKGFAVLPKLFAQVPRCFLVSILIRVFGISGLRVIP